MKKTTIFTQLVLLVAVSTSALAFGEDRFSIQKWSEDFAQSMKSKNAKVTLQLVDFNQLDKKVLADSNETANKAKMEQARKLFAKGQFAEARDLYNQISKNSSYWLQAVEERGWTYFRQNQFDDVLSQTKTLLSPQFADYIDSEAYFLQSLTQLKTCEYKDLFETDRLFKEKQKARLVEMQGLAQTGMNDALKNVMTSTENFPMKFSDVGANANHLPQLFFRDLEFQRQLLRIKLSEKALAILRSEVSDSKLQATFEQVKADSSARLQTRMKQLAQDETNDNFKMVQKLNLVEVEAIQRLHTDVELDKKLFKKADFKDTNSDQLVFVDDGRPWIDELDKYEVRAKACPQNIRRKM